MVELFSLSIFSEVIMNLRNKIQALTSGRNSHSVNYDTRLLALESQVCQFISNITLTSVCLSFLICQIGITIHLK